MRCPSSVCLNPHLPLTAPNTAARGTGTPANNMGLMSNQEPRHNHGRLWPGDDAHADFLLDWYLRGSACGRLCRQLQGAPLRGCCGPLPQAVALKHTQWDQDIKRSIEQFESMMPGGWIIDRAIESPRSCNSSYVVFKRSIEQCESMMLGGWIIDRTTEIPRSCNSSYVVFTSCQMVPGE